jgi:hypothetical protein
MLLVASLSCTDEATATQVAVRYPEGTVHGFLLLRAQSDSVLAHGNMLQTVKGSVVTSEMIFRFSDGSRFEERVTFSQDGVFRLRDYSLTLKGKSFASDLQITLNGATGRYRVEVAGEEESPAVEEGTLDLPADVYNGMVVTIAKNLTRQTETRVHCVAFMPEPRIVEIELGAVASPGVRHGGWSMNTLHFVVKPKLGFFLGALARLTGQLPPDNHIYIVTDGVPAFVRSDGPLYNDGPVWRIELAVPRM